MPKGRKREPGEITLVTNIYDLMNARLGESESKLKSAFAHADQAEQEIRKSTRPPPMPSDEVVEDDEVTKDVTLGEGSQDIDLEDTIRGEPVPKELENPPDVPLDES